MDALIIAKAGPSQAADTSRTCPLCQTVATGSSDAADGSWVCGRCGQRWDAVRLATAAAYTRYVATHPVH